MNDMMNEPLTYEWVIHTLKNYVTNNPDTEITIEEFPSENRFVIHDEVHNDIDCYLDSDGILYMDFHHKGIGKATILNRDTFLASLNFMFFETFE